ncbi:MAG: DUF2141 domain-containing protein [Novosphingobium sp.]|nr:DUF2141 domain-containing protein [Novosphingobium sp.]
MVWFALALLAADPVSMAVAAQPTAAPRMRSEPSLGTANARCRPDEPGPAVRIAVLGLKDRKGVLRAELYPDNDDDFMQDDNILLSEGKTFKRVDMDIPAQGLVTLCIRAPRAGSYTLALLHDRNGDHKFNPFADGAGFPGNPRIRRSKPKAALATVFVGSGVRDISIRMNYLRGLVFRPLKQDS